MRIKKLIGTALAAFVVASAAAFGLREMLRPPPPPPVEQLPDAVIVFCFHGAVRSEKCEKIESITHEVLEESFAEPLKEGKIVRRVLDYEAPENGHFRSDFRIVNACIVLADARSDRQGIAKNLEKKVWELADDKDAFKEYMRGQIEEILKQQ